MAEAEDVIVDAARHATVYARALWRRRGHQPAPPDGTRLADIARRLELLLAGAWDRMFPLRVAQPPAPATLLASVFRRAEGPRVVAAVPATDDVGLWLPARLADRPGCTAIEQYRVMALQQAVRAVRGSAAAWQSIDDPVQRALFVVLNAHAADAQLCALLPGVSAGVRNLRSHALARRPPLAAFPAHRAPLERWVREQLQRPIDAASNVEPVDACVARAQALRAAMHAVHGRGRLLFRDAWTGELRAPAPAAAALHGAPQGDERAGRPPRSARLARRPEVRASPEGEDDERPGAWMVQTAQPQEHAEDPIGLQRPTDRDESTAAEELADSLSELPEARLVTTPGTPKEVLLGDDPLESSRAHMPHRIAAAPGGEVLQYPEWDARLDAYRDRAVTVHVSAAAEGPQAWVDATLERHRAMASLVRRRFEMLKSQRQHLRKQREGDDLDLEACIDARADWRAGLPWPQDLYRSTRRARRDLAILLLGDVSGSTDAWVSATQRIIDVEREALLLVAIAMQSMMEPNAILVFSGEGPHGVVVRSLKSFEEPFDAVVARRVASLEPEHYTRAGAAIRHATALLMHQPARHRLLLMLSDGKPNDVDDYGGRYGVEDMHQAVVEARLQGVQPFCLTVDRQAADYVPRIFGPHQYALLPQPQLLPTVLLDWMRRLVRQ